MSGGMSFDEATSRRVEAVYKTPDVVSQRCRILEAVDLKSDERVLDIGSGPGLLAYDMAASVGPAGRVCGLDLSEDMLAIARQRCADQPWAEFHAGEATALPFPDGSFDAAASTQVYEYVADIPKALAELNRVLRPGGRAVIMDTDYGSLVLHTENAARMARVLAAWDQHFVHATLPRVLSAHLRAAGFTLRSRDVIPMFNPEYRDHTFAKGMIDVVAAYVAGRGDVSEGEAEAWRAEFAALGAQGRFFFSLNRYVFVADKPTAP